MSNGFIEISRPIIDVSAIATTVGTLTAFLPPMAALFTILWTAMRMHEMFTGRPMHVSIKLLKKRIKEHGHTR